MRAPSFGRAIQLDKIVIKIIILLMACPFELAQQRRARASQSALRRPLANRKLVKNATLALLGRPALPVRHRSGGDKILPIQMKNNTNNASARSSLFSSLYTSSSWRLRLKLVFLSAFTFSACPAGVYVSRAIETGAQAHTKEDKHGHVKFLSSEPICD